MNDLSSLQVHQCLMLHSSTIAWSQLTFSGGSLIWNRTVSTRKVTAVDGPSVLWADTGLPALTSMLMRLQMLPPRYMVLQKEEVIKVVQKAVDGSGNQVCKYIKHLRRWPQPKWEAAVNKDHHTPKRWWSWVVVLVKKFYFSSSYSKVSLLDLI